MDYAYLYFTSFFVFHSPFIGCKKMKPKPSHLRLCFLVSFLRLFAFLSFSFFSRIQSNIENIDYISQGILRTSRSSQFEAFNYAKQSDVLSLTRLCSHHPVAILSGGYQRTVNRIPFVSRLSTCTCFLFDLLSNSA